MQGHDSPKGTLTLKIAKHSENCFEQTGTEDKWEHYFYRTWKELLFNYKVLVMSSKLLHLWYQFPQTLLKNHTVLSIPEIDVFYNKECIIGPKYNKSAKL